MAKKRRLVVPVKSGDVAIREILGQDPEAKILAVMPVPAAGNTTAPRVVLLP